MFVRSAPSTAAPSRPRRWRGGAATVEFAFVCIPLFMMIAAALELGRAMMVIEFMGNAARTACRTATVMSAPADGTNLTNIQSAATNTLKIALVKTSTVNVYYYSPTSPSFTPPSDNSLYSVDPLTLKATGTWQSYPSASSSHPTSGDYVRVNILVNASDVTWVPFYWFLGKSGQFSVNEDIVVE